MGKETQPNWLNLFVFNGAGGRNRTDTGLPPLDFESSASTSFTTPAGKLYIAYILLCSQAKALNQFIAAGYCMVTTSCRRMVELLLIALMVPIGCATLNPL